MATNKVHGNSWEVLPEFCQTVPPLCQGIAQVDSRTVQAPS